MCLGIKINWSKLAKNANNNRKHDIQQCDSQGCVRKMMTKYNQTLCYERATDQVSERGKCCEYIQSITHKSKLSIRMHTYACWLKSYFLGKIRLCQGRIYLWTWNFDWRGAVAIWKTGTERIICERQTEFLWGKGLFWRNNKTCVLRIGAKPLVVWGQPDGWSR